MSNVLERELPDCSGGVLIMIRFVVVAVHEQDFEAVHLEHGQTLLERRWSIHDVRARAALPSEDAGTRAAALSLGGAADSLYGRCQGGVWSLRAVAYSARIWRHVANSISSTLPYGPACAQKFSASTSSRQAPSSTYSALSASTSTPGLFAKNFTTSMWLFAAAL
jgi:hypothetical protein